MSQYINIKSLLTSVSPIEDNAWEDFEQYFTNKTLKKNEFIWKTGEVCKYLIFIQKGAIRSYRYTGTKENTTHFFLDGSIFYDDYSFISQNPCIDTYETLEDTEVVTIPRAAIMMMYDKYKSFERLGRLMTEYHHTVFIEENHITKNLSSKEKYLQLVKKQQQILQRIPLKYIASYLNMTPEHLSKIRKELSISLD